MYFLSNRPFGNIDINIYGRVCFIDESFGINFSFVACITNNIPVSGEADGECYTVSFWYACMHALFINFLNDTDHASTYHFCMVHAFIAA